MGEDYTYQLNLCTFINKWCNISLSSNLNSCLYELNDSGIFTGDFIKAILKINAIAKELSCVCEFHNFIELKNKLDEIPNKTLKHVVNNMSLYV